MSRNQLDAETSPYLLLHKDNPVHWRPWGPDALEKAQEENKPILLSVGYTACHWCHVMNEESFTDSETAALMNELFVNIKVDREERPDLDQIYQTAAQTLGNQGGWPLTIFLTPQGEPFFAGTYFPKEARYGQAPFKSVLQEVARIWREQPEPVGKTTARVQQMYANLWSRDLRGQLDATVLDNTALSIGRRFDVFSGSAARRNFHSSAWWSCCGAPICAVVWSNSISWCTPRCSISAWAASTITSAVGCTVTPWTSAGSCRISRRCCTTMRSSSNC